MKRAKGGVRKWKDKFYWVLRDNINFMKKTSCQCKLVDCIFMYTCVKNTEMVMSTEENVNDTRESLLGFPSWALMSRKNIFFFFFFNFDKIKISNGRKGELKCVCNQGIFVKSIQVFT